MAAISFISSWDMVVYSRKGTWMFSATVWEREQRAFLEQHAPAHFQRPHAAAFGKAGALAEHLDACLRGGLLRPMMVRSSTDLPAPEPPDHAQHFAAIDVEVEMVVDRPCRRSR